ncbi:MAG: alkane 1-monooxygenase [Saprospiraceae bacterium]|nr:alkane 1-monooxygenase [Saprospiraceae bacterium]MDW8483501.1 alkane 1-monooxygenase [Saprospiraceae bacterium]
MRDAKYLFAYLLPLSAVIGLAFRGPWAWLTPVFSFVLIPLLELWMPQSTENVPPEEEASRSQRRFFDILLYLNFPILFGLTGWYLWTVQYQTLTTSEWIGLTFSAGIIVGAVGINVAHELGHRVRKYEQAMAKWMLMVALYQHFFIEHNRGHHKYVATDRDPATARRNEWLFAFWLRSMTGSWRSAWQLEVSRLRRLGLPIWSRHNEMLKFVLWQLGWLASVALFIGPKALTGALVIALIGVLLLESINYIEHYGLRRRILSNGLPEPVSPAHSWNSNHALGRIFLYELSRHSDHHYKATRKYQILRHLEESPQLPFGYPTSILLALIPPLWFRIMNPRLPKADVEPVS